MLSVGNQKDCAVKEKTDVRQGTLALMVLKTLDVLGALHGYGIARRASTGSRAAGTNSCGQRLEIGSKRRPLLGDSSR
jgi:hypothetical protein